jgi:hypothetical protein
MLLSCCFREPKGKRGKARKDGVAPETENKQQHVIGSGDSEYLLSGDVPSVSHVSVHASKSGITPTGTPLHQAWSTTASNRSSSSGLDIKLVQKERYPPSKQVKRLQKQRSQESVGNILTQSHDSDRVSIPYIDQSPVETDLPNPPPTPREKQPSQQTQYQETSITSHEQQRQYGRKGISTKSVPNLNAAPTKASNQSVEKSVSVSQVQILSSSNLQGDENSRLYKPRRNNGRENSPSKSTEKVDSPSKSIERVYSPSRSSASSPSHSDTIESLKNIDNNAENVFVNKMQRSTASYGIKDLLQEQIKKEEEEAKIKKVKEREDELEKELKLKYESIIEAKKTRT